MPQPLRKTRLETYEEILKTLSDNPATLSSIAYACNADCLNLRKRLEFLIQNSLVEEKIHNQKTYFVLTRRGSSVSRTFMMAKHLEKLKPALSASQETRRFAPAIRKKIEK
jgi:predicted transcriptional regulator